VFIETWCDSVDKYRRFRHKAACLSETMMNILAGRRADAADKTERCGLRVSRCVCPADYYGHAQFLVPRSADGYRLPSPL
jgi:hypothetical protein